MKMQIRQIEPVFGKEEIKLLSQVVSSSFISEQKMTRQFEERLAHLLGVKYAACVPNGTLALTVAAFAVGIKSGDEVIIPDLTMAGSVNGIILAGGTPIFCDVDPQQMLIDIEQIEKSITKKTKAIVAVDLNGRAPNYYKLRKLVDKHHLFLIEDAAQALGSMWKKHYLGSYGDIGCFSFSVPKIVTTGQGGLVVTNNPTLYQRILRIKDHGRRNKGLDIHDHLGFNFKFTDIQAAIGLAQLGRLKKNVACKKRLYRLYKNAFRSISQIQLIPFVSECVPWFIDVRVENRKKLQLFLQKHGIETRSMYPPLHKQIAYRNIRKVNSHFPVTEMFAENVLWLPSSVRLGEREVDYIANSIKRFYQ